MKKFGVFLFSILLVSIASIPSYAITPPTNLQIIEVIDQSGDCGQTQHGIVPPAVFDGMRLKLNISTAGTEDDLAPLVDGFRLTVHDSQGVLIGSEVLGVSMSSSAPVQVTLHINYLSSDETTFAPTSRPWLFTVEDIVFRAGQSTGFNTTYTQELIPMGTFIIDPSSYSLSCGSLPYVEPSFGTPLNQGNSENEIAIYNATDDNGEPVLHVYDINAEGEGTLALEITPDIIAPYIDNPPGENTALMTSENGQVTLYILDTGELQINSGPDAEGKIHVLIFDGIPPTNIYGYVIDPPMFP